MKKISLDGFCSGFVWKVAIVLTLCASPALAQYRAVYEAPRGKAELVIAAQFRDAQVLEQLASMVNSVVTVRQDVSLVGRSCGTVNAFYSPDSKEVVICYEFLNDSASKLAKALGKNNQPSALSAALKGTLIFVTLHEIGHSLIDIYDLPVLGREEDAADQFAAFVLLNASGDQWLKEATLFFRAYKPDWLTRLLDGQAVYGDEHSLPEQRLGNLACWGYGKNPSDFAPLIRAVKLPSSRLVRCGNEFSKLNKDVRVLLGDNLHIDGVKLETSGNARTPVYFELDQFTVSLSDNHFLQTSVRLLLDAETSKQLIQANYPVLRPAILTLLSSQSSSALSSPSGRMRLSEAVRRTVDEVAGKSGLARQVFFTSFVIQ